MNIEFYDCTEEVLKSVYSEYVRKVTENKGHTICTNVLCVVKYTRPKVTGGPDEYIDTKYKFLVTPMLIQWDDGQSYSHKTPFISFWFKNVYMDSVIKFAKLEDINWDNLIAE